eukprot:2498971-Alexandrium_andersonii.AAC.1
MRSRPRTSPHALSRATRARMQFASSSATRCAINATRARHAPGPFCERTCAMNLRVQVAAVAVAIARPSK